MSGSSSRSILSRATGSPAWAAANKAASTRITVDLRATCSSCGKTSHHLDLPDHSEHPRDKEGHSGEKDSSRLSSAVLKNVAVNRRVADANGENPFLVAVGSALRWGTGA